MSDSLDDKQKETAPTSGEDSENGKESSQIEQSTASEENASKGKEDIAELVNGMRPEFKVAMDSYEEFFDEYCEFMKKYSKSDNITSMLTDYMEYMTKYADTMKKLDEIGEEELNSVELKYYTEVVGRITQKLVEVST